MHWGKAINPEKQNSIQNVTSEFLTAANIHFEVFWILTPCSVLAGYQHFGGPCCLHLRVKTSIWKLWTNHTQQRQWNISHLLFSIESDQVEWVKETANVSLILFIEIDGEYNSQSVSQSDLYRNHLMLSGLSDRSLVVQDSLCFSLPSLQETREENPATCTWMAHSPSPN
jgi:hypothetical protein